MQLRIRAGIFGAMIALIATAQPGFAAKMVRGSDSAGRHGKAHASQSHGPENSKSHAAENGPRGMNRVSPEGSWKENGHRPSETSAPQGFSPSNPDAGALDKPGGLQGTPADQDGNNGCGNDLDREDDNNGWCGRPPRPPTASPTPAPSAPPFVPEILPTLTPGRPSVVLAGRKTRAGLPRTGADVVALLGGGVVLVGAGAIVRRRFSHR